MVSALRIDEVILHGIQRSIRGEAVAPELSEDVSDLSDRARGFLQQQVQEAMKHSRDIVEERGMGQVPGLIRQYWTGARSLLDVSQELAVVLQQSQPTVSPDGLLMVADATADGRKVFVVAKLEHEKGAQANREEDAEGKLVYSMRFLDDLFFTTGSKVYKIGLFPKVDGDALLDGVVVDRQAVGHTVAKYFREDYLGCAWKQRPEVLTERFMDTVQQWIDTEVTDPAARSRYQVALISDLQSRDGGLSINSFATRYIDPADQDAFRRHAQRTLPSGDIPKSLELISARLENVRYDMASGAVVIAPPEAVRNGTVMLEPGDAGRTRIIVDDQLDRTSGANKTRRA